MTFCWHRWSKWSRIIITADKLPVQYKECDKCGMKKLRQL